MALNEKTESVVKLNRMYFNEISFWRSDVDIPSTDLKINFSKSYCFNDSHDCCDVSLRCKLHDKDNEIIKIEANIIGSFSCDECDETLRNTLLQKNTLAILFPYIRSQISLVTAQPGMAPIVLPPMNIEAVFAEANQ